MDRQQQGPHDDDDFLENLRRAAARTSIESPSTAPDRLGAPTRGAEDTAPPAQAASLVSTGTADALRDLEARIADLEQQVRRLNEDRDRVVSDVADAVVARLDARWARALGEDAAGHRTTR
jgi:hypothetical protein